MFKTLVSYYRKNKKLLIIDLVCTLIFAFVDTIFPYLTKRILNGDVTTLNALIILGVILFGVYSLHCLCSYIICYIGHVLGIKMEADMRADLFKKFEEMDYSYFDDKQSGELLANLTSHLFEISEASHHSVEDILTVTIHISVPVTICALVNWKLTIVMVVGLTGLGIFTYLRRKKMMRCFRGVRKEQGELSAKIASSLSGIQLTKAYNNEEFELNNFNSINDDYSAARYRQIKEIAIFNSANNYIANATKIILLIISGVIIIKTNGEALPDLVMFFLYVNSLIGAVLRIPGIVETTQQAWSGYERFYNIMQIKNEIVSPENAKVVDKLKGKIEFKNVSFDYKLGNKKVLRDFSLTIEPGQKIGIVGETGVGKSTISKLIPRFYDILSGQILIDDVDIKEYDLVSLRSKIGHIQQDVFIFWGSIADNIRYGKPDATLEEIKIAAKKAKIDDFVNSLPDGYDTLCGERGVQLSGGQKQRISIARIFLKNPNILILDEATSALDNITEKIIQKSFDDLAYDKTCIVIAHRLTTVKRCDTIVVLGKNGIEEKGSHEELLKANGFYAKMYNASLEN